MKVLRAADLAEHDVADGELVECDRRTHALESIWGSSATNIWAGGTSGTMLHWNGASWRYVTAPARGNITALWGTSASNVWAVSDMGEVQQFDGTRWIARASGSTSSFYGL